MTQEIIEHYQEVYKENEEMRKFVIESIINKDEKDRPNSRRCNTRP